MAVMQMQKICICGLKTNRKAILEKMQALGVMEVAQPEGEVEGFSRMDTMNARQRFEKTMQTADEALAVLDAYAPEQKGMLAGLVGREIIDRSEFDGAVEERDAIYRLATSLIDKHKEIAEMKADILKLQNQKEALVPWLSLDVPMNAKGTARTALLIGTTPAMTTLDDLYAAVLQAQPEPVGVDITQLGSDKDAVRIAVICLKEDAGAVEEALRTSCGFARPSQPIDRKPADQQVYLDAEIQKRQERQKKLEEEIKAAAGERKRLELLSDYFKIRAEKYAVLGGLLQSGRTFVLTGYVPTKYVSAVEKAIAEKYDCIFEVDEIGEDEEPPVLLSNNGFSESVEGVLDSYGLPHKGEIDPTTIMSFFYVFFFGMMLSDAAYGAVIAIACFVVLKKFPHMESGMRKMMKLFMFCGVSTIVWGILFGGYFGDVVDVVSSTFFGVELTIAPVWFAPLNNPMKLLIYSLLFGIIHLFTGLGIKGYEELRDGKVMDFICDVVLWYVFLIGLILMFIPSSIFASIAQATVVFPAWLNATAKWMAIIGAVGIVLMSARDNKNPVLRILLGAYDLYNVTGWLSDVLSYSRLLALGLATGVIASVINQMGSMFGKGIVGAIGFALVFVIGHVLNLAINLLGAYVHTNRLQYVEFFGKFYDGGGKPFEPFESDTRYVTIQSRMDS